MAGGPTRLRPAAVAVLLPAITACSAAEDSPPPVDRVGEEAALEQADAMLEMPASSEPQPAPTGSESVRGAP